ncbi:hypothetical protein BDW68DRAFT_153624 [Aspergillus falconensis]
MSVHDGVVHCATLFVIDGAHAGVVREQPLHHSSVTAAGGPDQACRSVRVYLIYIQRWCTINKSIQESDLIF